MFIYKTTNLVNGKYYIGKYAGKRSTYLGSGTALKKSIEKYGRRNFKREILEYCNSLQELSDKERYWIDLFDAVNDPRSYNLTEGGQGSFSHITNIHYEERNNRRYGKALPVPPNAITSDYIQKYVVVVDGIFKIIPGMDNVSEYLQMNRSQVYSYLGLQEPKKGYKYNSLLVDYYTEESFLIEGKKYSSLNEVLKEFNIKKATITHRCLKSDRFDWWKIVEVKDKWKKL